MFSTPSTADHRPFFSYVVLDKRSISVNKRLPALLGLGLYFHFKTDGSESRQRRRPLGIRNHRIRYPV
jgi:hypothetical protein